MTKNFREYLAEHEFWSDRPAAGDSIGLEIGPDELIETAVIESDGINIVLKADDTVMQMLESRGLLSEKIQRYGPVGSSRAMGYTVSEGVMSEIDMDLRHIAKTGREDALIDALSGAFGDKTADYLQNMMSEI